MPDRTVKTTPTGVTNPYGTYTALYKQHRMDKMYAKSSNDYSVKGGSGNSEAPKASTKDSY